ncbi:unnamed protein product [Prorocentrum cordatum]|uniref:DUF3456 domain-containing protein n=1 Tax=Prorocentrum cordatum TaxID=2364126 RepID=A0ABN9QZD0_9DINO|nr:unnamed protein product [Polarella glacialis]
MPPCRYTPPRGVAPWGGGASEEDRAFGSQGPSPRVRGRGPRGRRRAMRVRAAVLVLVLCPVAGRDHPNRDEISPFLGPSLACELCTTAMDNFRFDVARRIKSSMSPTKKAKVFEKRIAIPCSGERGWPKLMGVVEEDGKEKYIDVVAAAQKAKESTDPNTAAPKYKQMGPEVRNNALDACRYFVQGHQEMLLDAIMKNEAGRASDLNFHRLVCGDEEVCPEEDVADKGDDELFENDRDDESDEL